MDSRVQYSVWSRRYRMCSSISSWLGGYPTEQVLKAFNNMPLEAKNDSLIIRNCRDTVTMLFLGNSLTYTGVPDEEPNKEKRGLTSTCVDSDYVHRVVKMVSTKHKSNIKYSICNLSDFERSFITHPFSMRKLDKAEVKQPDILIVQIGENVSEENIKDPKKFETEYVKLLSNFPHAKRVITLPFWPSKQKEYAITNVAIRTNSYLVDISHLGDCTDPQNFAKSYKKYKKPGVGEHPGDVGMKHIADCLYATINAIEN